MDSKFTHIRPRFRIEVDVQKRELLTRVEKMLLNTPKNISGRVIENHIVLDVVGYEAHFWSPHLNFRIEEDELDATKSIVHGVIGPKPSVWTLFIFIYTFIGTVGFFISSYGVSRYMMGENSFTLWGFPISLIVMLSAYFVGKFGEGLAQDQIVSMKQFVHEATDLEL